MLNDDIFVSVGREVHFTERLFNWHSGWIIAAELTEISMTISPLYTFNIIMFNIDINILMFGN